MKFSGAAALTLAGVVSTNNYVLSFVLHNPISSSRSFFQKQPDLQQRPQKDTPLFGLKDKNTPELSDTNKKKILLDITLSTYLDKYLPRTSTTQYFKRGSDLEEEIPEETAVWARALKAIMPNYFPSIYQDIESSQKSNSTENHESNATFLSNQIDVDALLKASAEFDMKQESSDEIATYLDAVLAQSDLNNVVLQNTDKNEYFNKMMNNTVSSLLSYLEWGASSLTSSSPIKIEKFIEETTSQLNYFFIRGATSLMIQSDETMNPYLNTNAIQDIIQNINVSSKSISLAMDRVLVETETLAKENGLDVGIVVEEARGNAMELIEFGNSVLADGYVSGPNKKQRYDDEYEGASVNALFDNFDCRNVKSKEISSIDAGKMADLSAAIYEEDMVERAHKLDQTIVASGSTSDVSWLVTDSIISNTEEMSWDKKNTKTGHSLVRTITIKGFDASDENVDRERLLGNIWTATPEILSEDGKIGVHSGLLSIAKGLYDELNQYLDGLAPSHKIILNGHSIGGSLSNLLLMILAKEKGAEWTKKTVLKVYTFGAPPIACIVDSTSSKIDSLDERLPTNTDLATCDVLSSFDLPTSIVNGFCQPWDPIPRLFSEIDPLYPLLDDIGVDGNTLWASGPSRTLRPLTRSIVESWENWPSLRDKFRETASQSYLSVGKQYLLLPETTRYLMDRLVSVNIPVPDTDVIVELPSKQLLSALEYAFPLDTFGISMVPTALRSFIHHFHPAYSLTLQKFSNLKQPEAEKELVESEDISEAVSSYTEAETHDGFFQ